METKKKYQSPQLTVATFKAERGYVVSGFRLAIFDTHIDEGSENLENRQMSDQHWGNDWNY
jgi:hypothetical protein